MSTSTKILGTLPVYRGNYDDETRYWKDNLVTIDNSTFIHLGKIVDGVQTYTVGIEPSVVPDSEGSTYWKLFSGIPSLFNVTLVDNPEYMRAYVDHDDKLLYGIKADGSFEFAKGVPTPIKTELDNERSKIEAIMLGAELLANVSQNVIYANTETHIIVSAKLTQVPADKIIATIDNENIFEYSNTDSAVFGTVSLTINGESKKIIVVEAIYKGSSFKKEIIIKAGYPIMYGFGTDDNLPTTRKSARLTSLDTYTATNNEDNNYFYILVPAGILAPTKFSMNGIAANFTTSTKVINGVTYTVCKSGATYNNNVQLNIKAE